MAFKSVQSILQPDPRFADLCVVELGASRRITLADHHTAVASIHLAGAAPADVQAALDRARNTMIYAFFDYDLFVVGEVQAFGAFELELSLLDQFEALAVGKVDAAICRLPLSHDGLVQCTVLLEEKKKLVVPAGHRLSDRELIDPEELALETCRHCPTIINWERGQRSISLTTPLRDGRSREGQS